MHVHKMSLNRDTPGALAGGRAAQLHSRLGVASMAKSKSGHGLTSRTASTGPARVYTDEGQGTFRDSSDCFGG